MVTLAVEYFHVQFISNVFRAIRCCKSVVIEPVDFVIETGFTLCLRINLVK